MTRFLLLLIVVWRLEGADYRYSPEGVILPDPIATPGVVTPASKWDICTNDFRNKLPKVSTSVKRQVCKDYGVKTCSDKLLEIDYLIPPELGGADDVKNVWPQPAKPEPGFHQKDDLENYLRGRVCAGEMELTEAQAQIRANWYEAWIRMRNAPGK